MNGAELVGRRILAACYADLIIGTSFFAVSGYVLIYCAVAFWSAATYTSAWPAALIGAAFVLGAFPYSLALRTLSRTAWQLPKQLWAHPAP